MYKDIDPSSGFESDDRPFTQMSEKNKEDARKIYAMVSNIDDNVGKVNDSGVSDLIEIKDVYLPEMECDLVPYYATKGKSIFPFWVEFTRILSHQ